MSLDAMLSLVWALETGTIRSTGKSNPTMSVV
jgi:hypothetical protein